MKGFLHHFSFVGMWSNRILRHHYRGVSLYVPRTLIHRIQTHPLSQFKYHFDLVHISPIHKSRRHLKKNDVHILPRKSLVDSCRSICKTVRTSDYNIFTKLHHFSCLSEGESGVNMFFFISLYWIQEFRSVNSIQEF